MCFEILGVVDVAQVGPAASWAAGYRQDELDQGACSPYWSEHHLNSFISNQDKPAADGLRLRPGLLCSRLKYALYRPSEHNRNMHARVAFPILRPLVLLFFYIRATADMIGDRRR